MATATMLGPEAVLPPGFPGLQTATMLMDEPGLEWVVLAGFWLFGVVLAVLWLILVMRLQARLHAKHRLALVARWRPLIAAAAMGDEAPPPQVPARDWADVASLWNHMHEVMRGEARERLETFGRAAGLAPFARRALGRGPVRLRILAALTLGHLRVQDAWDALSAVVGGQNAALSFAAARALVQLDAPRAIGRLMPAIVGREEWSVSLVAGLLAEAGPELADGPLGVVARTAGPAERVRALRFMIALRCPSLQTVVTDMLHPDLAVDVVASALRAAGRPEALPAVRILARHAEWPIRCEAAAALGRLGQPADVALLQDLVKDDAWWVRYRAAQALGALPFLPAGKLADLATTEPDARAREVLAHVVAERSERVPGPPA